ncbi:DUF5670 family protein [uncultured Nostoc sp.]|uniref:DUF5670 family protein n=1 Tax=uncultured Nostoc sp. TaxID=340711 RepID=UPI0035CB78F3
MLSILWGIVVLIAFWALGLVLHIAGNLIHAVLLLAIAQESIIFSKRVMYE